jgi:hypothetical protein
MFTSRAKYGGDHQLLGNEIAAKLVKDKDERKRKGVEQLAHAVNLLFRDGGRIDGIDLTGVRKVYPLLVTLDDIGATLMITRFLNFYFSEYLDRSTVRRIEITPVFCTDIESLELVIRYSDIRPLSGFLQHWLDSDIRLSATLQAFLPGDLPARRNEMLDDEWGRMSDDFQARLFPVEHAASSEQSR